MTKLTDILDADKLRVHINDKLVSAQRHPTLPLRILNYTQKAQFSGVWGDGVIDYCRGLIVDDEDTIVARPFKKFHNLNTPSIPETMEENLPPGLPTITQKFDGSLGIYYYYGGQEGIATRGSFASPQAIWATRWYRYQHETRPIDWPARYTPLFEIIYPENRIVVKYDFEGLVLLGMVGIEDGHEPLWTTVRDYATKNYLRFTPRINMSLREAKEVNQTNEEGYVLTYPTWSSPLKIKVKMEDYVRLHRIVTGVSPKAIWELLSSGKEFDALKDCPEEFQTWVTSWTSRLRDEYDAIYNQAIAAYVNRPFYSGEKAHRADCAAYFKLTPDLQGVLFGMLDNRDVSPIIWKMIKPRGDDQSFRQDGE